MIWIINQARRNKSHISYFQLSPVLELLKRLWIGKGFSIFNLNAMHHIAHRQLDNLAALGAGYITDLQNDFWHMARRGIGADLAFDFTH